MASVSRLGPDGRPAATTRTEYDAERRLVKLEDGRGETRLSYAKSGYPSKVVDPLGRETAFCYNPSLPLR